MKISLNPKGLVCGLYLPMPVRFPAGAADGCHADNPHRGGWDHEVLLIDRWDMGSDACGAWPCTVDRSGDLRVQRPVRETLGFQCARRYSRIWSPGFG